MKKAKRIHLFSWVCLLAALTIHSGSYAQGRKKATPAAATSTSAAPAAKSGYDEGLYKSLQYRSIGPFRGGRSAAVTGVPGKPNLYYFGSTGGGVWRTQDGGQTYENISDGYFGGSIGAIAVAESDPNVIYVGGGEKTVRGNVSHGYGMFKSVDAGKTWKHIGLKDSRHIPRVRIHPQNPDLVYAAVLGNIFKPHPERGVFRSKDGGTTWEKVLFVDDEVGAFDLTFDPTNPRILYASTWRLRRTPYSLSSGGPGSALWKSTDGGDTWKELTTNPGMPKDTLGIIGVTVSPINPERVWAIVESKTGGVFRSENGGKSWTKVNEDRSLRQRAWYYTRIYADTKDEDIVYVLNVSYHKSKDGGKTFQSSNAPHGDHHDLWIAPEDNQRMIIGDDGGAQVSFDGGDNWSTYHNQPTAQYYRVITDNHFPYRIYVAQQDNSTLRVAHRTAGFSITESDWETTAGCECGHIAVDPNDNDIVYGGCYDGLIERKNHKIDQTRSVNVWPDNPMGHGVEDMKYRFQWNFPILFSLHDSKKLYTGSNHLHASTDGGHTWQVISPDLTRNEPSKMGSSGGPITQDNTSVEYYCTIFAVAESPRVKDLIWVGSDDGLLHLTRDGGKNWSKVNPPNMPEWIQINSIEADPHNDGGCYVAATMYKSGDFTPYLYRTKDYGQTWTLITKGIEAEHFTRVVRADPKRPGLLYAGTESGMYISFDDGANWQPFQLNLPIVPITDLTIKNDNLIVATQGRSLWLIDDLTPLHQLNDNVAKANMHLYQPLAAYRMEGGQSPRPSKTVGMNHPNGVMVHYFIKEMPDTATVTLAFKELDGDVIKTYSNKAKERKEKLEVKKGANMFVWDTRYPDGKDFEGMILWWASLSGAKALPGKYKVALTVNGQTQEQEFEILKDPRSEVSAAEMVAQFDFIKSVNEKVSEAHQSIKDIQTIRKQLKFYTERMEKDPQYKDLLEKAKSIDKAMTEVEETLYQTKNRSNQDPLNFPIRLTNKLAHLNALMREGDYGPTQQALQVRDELTREIDKQLDKFNLIKSTDLPAFNRLIKQTDIEAIRLEGE